MPCIRLVRDLVLHYLLNEYEACQLDHQTRQALWTCRTLSGRLLVRVVNSRLLRFIFRLCITLIDSLCNVFQKIDGRLALIGHWCAMGTA